MGMPGFSSEGEEERSVVDNCVKTGVVVKHERGQARLPVSGSLRQKVARSLVMLGLEMLWAGVVAIWMPWVCSWVVNLWCKVLSCFREMLKEALKQQIHWCKTVSAMEVTARSRDSN